jgi:MATE family multidrug resistance protein
MSSIEVPAHAAYGHRAIFTIAAPMIVSSVTVPLVGIVGTGVLGHMQDEQYLAGVAAGTQIFSVLFVGLNCLRMGTTGLTAQAHGAGDGAAVRRSLGQAGILALVLGLLLVAARAPLRDASLLVLGPPPDVAPWTRQYFDIRIFSAPMALFNLVAIGWLLGRQDGRGPLLITLAINLVNIALDLWFVLGLGLGVRGVAAGALIAETAGAVVALLLLRRSLATLPGGWDVAPLRRPSAYLPLFAINGNLFVRTLALMFTFTFMTAQGARMGGTVLAANALLLNFQWLLSYALDGIANAAEALVGRAIGAGDRKGLLLAVRRTLGWSLGFAAAFFAFYLLAGPQLVALLTDLPAVRRVALEYLPWLVAAPLISVWSFFYDGVYVGATRSREMRVVMTGAAALVFLPAWFLTREAGNHALWFAFTLFMAARGLAMHVWFRRLVASATLVPPAVLPPSRAPGEPA